MESHKRRTVELTRRREFNQASPDESSYETRSRRSRPTICWVRRRKSQGRKMERSINRETPCREAPYSSEASIDEDGSPLALEEATRRVSIQPQEFETHE